MSSCGDERPDTASENQKETGEAVGDLASVTPRPQQPQADDDIILGTLEEQLKFVIRNDTGVHSVESSALGVGDILELDELEELRVESERLPMLEMGYRVEEFVDRS